MNMLFSDALEIGSIAFRWGKGGSHGPYHEMEAKCAMEAAMAAMGLGGLIATTPYTVRGSEGYYTQTHITNYALIGRTWPYMEKLAFDDFGRIAPISQFVWQMSDRGIPRQQIVEFVRKWERQWGIKPTLQLEYKPVKQEVCV